MRRWAALCGHCGHGAGAGQLSGLCSAPEPLAASPLCWTQIRGPLVPHQGSTVPHTPDQAGGREQLISKVKLRFGF